MTVEATLDRVVILRLEGDLDAVSAAELPSAVETLLDAATQLVIDLSGVQNLDPSGLDALRSVECRCRQQGRYLVLVLPEPSAPDN